MRTWGWGWDVTIDAFDRSAHDDAWLDSLRHDGRRSPRSGPSCRRTPLTAKAADPYFRAERLLVEGTARPEFNPPTYLVGVVIAGEGSIQAGSGSLHVRRGETFALPAAALADLAIEAPPGLELIACQPGGPGWDCPQPETSDHATSTETE